MNNNYEKTIEDINSFVDYNKKSLAQFKAAIIKIETAKEKCIKKLDFIGAWKLLKLQTKLEMLQNKKTFSMEKQQRKKLKIKH